MNRQNSSRYGDRDQWSIPHRGGGQNAPRQRAAPAYSRANRGRSSTTTSKAAKRKAPTVVDLTEDDDDMVARSAQARSAPRPYVPSPVSGQQFNSVYDTISLSEGVPSTQAELEEEANAAALVDSSQEFDDSAYASFELYGILPHKIVGVRYYDGQATKGECVNIRREPGNPYDSNAIRIDNVMGEQIGHLPRQLASKLAPYIDSADLMVEGILAGNKGVYECPINLRLYGTSEPTQQLELLAKMKADRLPVAELLVKGKDKRRQQPQKAKSAANRSRNGKRKAEERDATHNAFGVNMAPPGASQTERDDQQSIDDIISQSVVFNPREMGQVVEKFGTDEKDLATMPMAECPAALLTELLPYQRQGLAWMLDRESPKLPEVGSNSVVQLWKRQGTAYKNIATSYVTSQAPPLASGGILADDMGLGKTIQTISLILADSTPRVPHSSKTTLIISPLGVMSNWRDQIATHVKEEHALKVLIYHGVGKKEAENLNQYDVVVTTYGALATEFGQIDGKGPKFEKPEKGLFSVHWRRVVLDEGHTIRSPRTKGARAACTLEADSRWSLTGTPIINNLKDLYSQLRYLRLTGGLEDFSVFNSALIRPLKEEDPSAHLVLQALMGTICLRRKKEMNFINLRLPPMQSHILHVKFLPHEKEKYDMFQAEAKGVLMDYSSRQKTNVTYSHLLEVILRLRQVCNHWKLCQTRVNSLMALLENNEVVSLTPENIKALQTLLQIKVESQETCPVCLDDLNQPVITPCAHTFDYHCIEQVIERQHKCPLCRAEIPDTSQLVHPAIALGEDDSAIEIDPEESSSKIDALIKILTAHGQAPGTKTVVFSQWTSFLNMIEPQLRKNNINYTRIDGKMNSTKRDAAMDALTNDPDCTVMLASLGVCSVGLNLVAANQVILADSWWAPAIEDQAVDRVYRLGQKRPTTVWRLVMEGSIEDRVLNIQKRKRDLMTTAFRENNAKKGEEKRERLADLEKLLQ
ncbi:DEAD-like helicase [Emydomyces testavorans]|uniref:DEAD-like helicase n=1 Tax=Emydomyces testavorans TaxID=2070801 RepID=A0AAF0DDL7_9EURO|nr:DEAD-like helicase [Emydomyces testavorans]